MPNTPSTVDLSSNTPDLKTSILEMFDSTEGDRESESNQACKQASLPNTPIEPLSPSQHVKPVEVTYKRRSKRRSSTKTDEVQSNELPTTPVPTDDNKIVDMSDNTPYPQQAEPEVIKPLVNDSETGPIPSRRSKRITGEKVTVQVDVFKTPQRKKACSQAIQIPDKRTPLYRSPSSLLSNTPGKKPATPSPRAKRNCKGETPLHRAVISGNVERTRELLQYDDVDPNAEDNAGWTPLHDACNKQRYDCVRVLLEHGANINCKSSSLDTPLHDACAKGSTELVKLLLSYGANSDIKNQAGLTPMDYTHKKDLLDLISSTPQKTEKYGVADKELYLTESNPMILFSGIHSADLPAIKDKKLTFNVENSFTDQVTHLICGVDYQGYCKRTIKFFQAMAKGVPILSLLWVTESLKKNAWQPMNSYFVKGVNGYKAGAPKLRYENRSKPGLLTGLSVYVDKKLNSVPGKDVIIDLISSCNATVLTREPKALPVKVEHKIYHAKTDSVFNTIPYVVVCNDIGSSSCGIPARTAAWILDCITDFQISE